MLQLGSRLRQLGVPTRFRRRYRGQVAWLRKVFRVCNLCTEGGTPDIYLSRSAWASRFLVDGPINKTLGLEQLHNPVDGAVALPVGLRQGPAQAMNAMSAFFKSVLVSTSNEKSMEVTNPSRITAAMA